MQLRKNVLDDLCGLCKDRLKSEQILQSRTRVGLGRIEQEEISPNHACTSFLADLCMFE